MDVLFQRDNEDGSVSRVPGYFRTLPEIIHGEQQLDVNKIINSLNQQIDAFNRRGSGFTVDRIMYFFLCCSPFRPLQPSSYIPTPPFLRKKHCLVNPRNTDNMCLLWSVLAALHPPSSNPDKVQHYKRYLHTLNIDGLTFPVETKQLPLFEKLNPSISLNVLYFDRESKGFTVEYISSERGRDHHINLLLLDDPTNPTKRHYVLIRNMSALVSHRSKYEHAQHVCNSCLHPFVSREVLDKHVPFCSQHAPQQVIYPDPGNEKDCVLMFRQQQKQHPIPIYLVADFESFLEKPERAEDEGSNTKIVDHHLISGFCCYRVTEHVEHQTPPYLYSGPDPMTMFYEHVMAESRAISAIVTGFASMLPLTLEQAADYDRALSCGNCGGAFTKGNRKVHHHCHISGKYLFAACNNCNLQLKPVKKQSRKKHEYTSTAEWAAQKYENSYFIPVVFHNLKCYDAHFIIRHFERKHVERRNDANEVFFDDVHIVPLNSEKYLQFQIGNLRFLDSYQFLSASLDELVSLVLKAGKHNFVHTSTNLGTKDDIVFAKGVYPYAYMSSRDKFAETQLPPIEAFHDSLKDEPLSQEDYMRAQQVWSRFGMRSMQQYHDHYLLTDVLLLADVFEYFRTSVLNTHKLDCLHFITLPSLAWAMALKHTRAKLDLITDPDAYLMLENNMRGGIASISQRYASANNQYVEGYDDSEPSRFITYLDANSLYATAQSEPLPVGNFRFLEEVEIRDFDLDSIEADAEIGYIVECDLSYPAHLHDMHNDYPMAPEHLTVTRDMLSPFALSLLDPARPWTPSEKLVPNLLDKTKYVAHYRNLQLYTRHGLVITKIHRILSFTQSAWLKPWIDLCNEQRRAARSDFESDMAKLQANATFGKTLEQVRNRVNIRLIADPNKLLKTVASVSFRQSEIINSDLVMVRAARTKVKLNKPIAVGFSILEISKLIMYKFYYDHLKVKYRNRCSLLFTDTDSLCCEIQTDDLYSDMGVSLDHYDTSNFAQDHPQYSTTNRRVLGKFKSETGSDAPSEFVGLRAKMYSLYVPRTPTKCHKKAKGIQKHYVRNRVRHRHFVEVLRNARSTTMSTFRTFRSTNHVVSTVEITKLCLCAFDDKRYILDDGAYTLAYVHFSLNVRV